jgi:hypothetical protein
MRTLLSPALVAVLSLSMAAAPISTVQAAPGIDPEKKSRAQALYEAGKSAYRLSDFATAAEKFEAAYKEVPLPTFLYNIGLAQKRLFEKGLDVEVGRAAKAVLENYLIEIQKDPNLGDEAEIRSLIDSLDESIAEEDEKRAEAEEKDRQAEIEKAKAQNRGKPMEPGVDPGKKMKLGGAIGLGVGGAFLVSGVIVIVVMAGRIAEFQKLADDSPEGSADQQTASDNGAEANLVMGAAGGPLIGLGVVGLTVGAIFLAKGTKRTKAWQKKFDIAVTPTFNGMAISGRF